MKLKLKKLFVMLLSMLLTTIILTLTVSAAVQKDFGVYYQGYYSGRATLSPVYASCEATTDYVITANPNIKSKFQYVFLKATFVGGDTHTDIGTFDGFGGAKARVVSTFGHQFSSAQSIHEQTINGLLYRTTLNA